GGWWWGGGERGRGRCEKGMGRGRGGVGGHWRNGVPPIRRQPRSNNLQRPWWQLTGAREVQKQREFEPDGVQPSKAALALCHETQGSQNAPLLKRGGDAARKRAGAVALENGRPIDYPPNVESNPWLQLLSSIGCSAVLRL